MTMAGSQERCWSQERCVGAQGDGDGRSQGRAEKAPELQPRQLPEAPESSHQGQEMCKWLLLSLATVPRSGVELPSEDSTPAKGMTS